MLVWLRPCSGGGGVGGGDCNIRWKGCLCTERTNVIFEWIVDACREDDAVIVDLSSPKWDGTARYSAAVYAGVSHFPANALHCIALLEE